MLTVDEVAERLRLNRRTILRLAEQGKIPAVRLGKMYRFPVEALEEMFAAKAVKS